MAQITALSNNSYRKSSNYSAKKIIQDTTYNVRRESEFICTLMEKSATGAYIRVAL